MVFNEFMSTNTGTLADVDGAFSDWIELYNPGAAAVNLTGAWLSDDAALPLKWQFPRMVPAHGWLVVWASDKNGVLAGGQLHPDFKIGAAGEPLLSTAADGVTLLDQAPAMLLTADQSYARQPDGAATWAVYNVATPGAADGDPRRWRPLRSVSAQAGFHAASLDLELATTDPLATIRYTLDGSEPTATSAVYTGPITIDDRAERPGSLCADPDQLHGARPLTPGGCPSAPSTRSRSCARAPSAPA